MTTEQKTAAWETETGLPNDIDAWITKPHFGLKDEYAEAVQAAGGEGTMFIIDLVDANGEIQGSQGYSIGTGWIVSDDGLSISHPKRHNVVGGTLYGQLQNRVVKELRVPMGDYGLPTEAKSWDALGFHWMQQLHTTVAGPDKPGLMPTEFLGKKEGGVTPKPAVATVTAGVAAELEVKLKDLAQANAVKDFQKAALKIPEVVANDDLMATILDEGPTGFWATHQ